jgi:high-affinity nickel-transport protein
MTTANSSAKLAQISVFPNSVKSRTFFMYALLIGVNLGAWIWALIAFHNHPVLLGTALLAYTFGLRHAVDADHIAAIDNVTRKLMQEGKRPVGVGFFFLARPFDYCFWFVGCHRLDFGLAQKTF